MPASAQALAGPPGQGLDAWSRLERALTLERPQS